MLTPLGRVLSGSLAGLTDRQGYRQALVQLAWEKAVGQPLARLARPAGLRGEILVVRTAGPAWSQEILLRQKEILQRLKGVAPELSISGLRCVVGRLELEKMPAGPQPARPDADPAPLPEEAVQRIERLAGQVSDPALAGRLRRLLELLEQHRQAALAAGRLPCPICGTIPQGPVCIPCRLKEQRRRRRRILNLLGRRPWLTLRDLQEQVPDTTGAEVATLRLAVRSRLHQDVWAAVRELPQGTALPRPLRRNLQFLTSLVLCVHPRNLVRNHYVAALGPTLARSLLTNQAPGPRKPGPKGSLPKGFHPDPPSKS